MPRTATWRAGLEGLQQAFDLGIAPDSVTPDLLRRIRILSIATVVLVLVGVASAIQFESLGLPHMSVAISLTMVASLANLALLRATRRPLLCGHLGVGMLAALLVISAITTGGFYDPNFSWLYVLPLCAAVVVDPRGAALWTAVSLMLAFGFWLAPGLGVPTPSLVPEPLRTGAALFSRTSAILTIGLLTGSFVVAQRRAERELHAANAELSRETAYVTLLRHAAVSANEATSFEQALRDGLTRLCDTLEWPVGHIFWVRENGAIESSGIFYVRDEEPFDTLRIATLELGFTSGSGLPGRAVATGRAQRELDLLADGLMERARLAHLSGLRGAFAVPVFVGGQVRAVLEFATTEQLSADDRLLDVFQHIGDQLGRVAERTELQERLRRSQKLEAVGQLAAGLAHEINNPMSYVRSNLNVVLEEWRALHAAIEKDADGDLIGSLDLCEELLGECLEGIERTVSIVRDVQEFSHVGTGHGPIDVQGLVDSAVRVAIARCESDVAIERDVEAIDGFVGASHQLHQVLVNLLVNAIQAAGPRGRFRVSARSVAGFAVLRVEDDGPGVPLELRERIFEPFFTTKAVGEGTGLGLFLSYEIVRNHGGEIRLETESGRGTVFELRLPLGEREVPS